MTPIVRNTVFALAIAATPAFAWAEDAFTLQQTDLFAGPDSEFPQVASLPPNTEVGVAGCLSDWSWCDVSFSNQRGWVWAGDLGYPYEGRRVAIIEYGPRLRLPAVTFSLNTYWDEHYRSRPFYRERNVWVSRVHVEGGHGGRAPHGGTRVATPSQGQQPQAQGAQRPQPQAQGAQRPPEAAQRQGDERAKQEAQQRQGDQRAREEAAQKSQSEQRNRQEAQRAQPNTPQANAARHPEEAMGSREGRQQPEASRGQQAEQRAQSTDQHAQSADQQRAQPDQGRGNTAQERPQPRETQSSSSSESMRGQPDRGASAKGPQNEASRGQPDRGANAKGPQGERPKEEGKEQQ